MESVAAQILRENIEEKDSFPVVVEIDFRIKMKLAYWGKRKINFLIIETGFWKRTLLEVYVI
jgi:hypothetical protein